LLASGIDPNDSRLKHVQFEGADVDAVGTHYGASIPFEKAMQSEVIIAYKMNDEIIPKDHGY
jgi:sulfite oxidase